MKVLLVKEVPGLGTPGEVVEVRDGFARNYLFPRKLAVPPTPHELSRYEKLRARYEAEISDRRSKAQALAQKLQDAEFLFTRRVHDKNKLYAAVRAHDLAQAIAEKFGEEIPADHIKLEPIHELGTYPVEIQLYEDIKVTVRVRVEPAA
ncbi:MAG: 50S ribosomal protein L9 [Candidatus Bipolaricaulota bacterium]|nr:50S ribosomal protein L9 [Candidatus Bipolaricaulota bacterium]MDW8127406.1 50S ribosomal protein L9 [Candidatus Bipolaricaulota bacterium]